MRSAFSAVAIGVALLLPTVSLAKTSESFEISGWIPYWRAELGAQSILPNLSTFTEVNPFVYSVKQDGSLFLNSPLDSEPWAGLRAKAKELNVRFIPTVMWANPDAIDDVLRDPAKRTEHVRGIVREVYARGLDGIDIDYEGKYARTRPYFSLFLKDLYEAMGYDKWVMCTIEARTPLDSRFSSPEAIPTDIEYANDFPEINKYCDRVRIMAYDQGRFDLKLNDMKGHPYVPVADTDWVEKVMRLTAEDIDTDKLVIGVATYGYEYDMFTEHASGQVAAVAAILNEDDTMRYSRLWSFNPGYALDFAAKLGLIPTRNSAGEMQITYPASQSLGSAIPLPFATRIMSWSDAGAIDEKAKLAKELGLRGIAVFKIDGGQDPNAWSIFASHRNTAPVTVASPVLNTEASPENASGAPSAGSSLSIPARDLEYGLRIEDVRALQKLLNAHGFTVASGVDSTGSPQGGSPGNETVFFGPATRAALIRFQKANNIKPAIGYFGPITRKVFHSLGS